MTRSLLGEVVVVPILWEISKMEVGGAAYQVSLFGAQLGATRQVVA